MYCVTKSTESWRWIVARRAQLNLVEIHTSITPLVGRQSEGDSAHIKNSGMCENFQMHSFLQLKKALLNKIAPSRYLGFTMKTNVHMDSFRFFTQMTNYMTSLFYRGWTLSYGGCKKIITSLTISRGRTPRRKDERRLSRSLELYELMRDDVAWRTRSRIMTALRVANCECEMHVSAS